MKGFIVTDYRAAQCEKMLQALRASDGVGLTRTDFAKLLGIKKSKHLVGLIDELVSRQLALVETQKLPNGLAYYRYKSI